MGLRCIKQLVPVAATEEVLIDGSQPSSLLLKLVNVCEFNGAAGVFRIRLALSGAPTTADEKQWLRYDYPIGAFGFEAIVLPIAVRQGDKVYVTTDTGDIAFNVFAEEGGT